MDILLRIYFCLINILALIYMLLLLTKGMQFFSLESLISNSLVIISSQFSEIVSIFIIITLYLSYSI